MSKIKEEYKKEKGFDVWVEHPNYGSYTDDYVNWLEEQLRYDEDDLRHIFECFDQYDNFDKQLKEYNAPI